MATIDDIRVSLIFVGTVLADTAAKPPFAKRAA